MRRRLLLKSGSAAAVMSALAACGGGGGGGMDAGTGLGADPTPSRGLAPVTSATAVALPDKILACYYTTWDTSTYKLSHVPTEFNVLYLFHAKPNGKPVNGSYNNVGDGSFYFEHYDTVRADDIQFCRRRGQRVLLTVGGAGAGFAFTDRGQSQNFVASFQAMAQRLGGLDGVDFNNYEAATLNDGNVAAVATEMVWIAAQLKSIFGASFAVTSPPQPNDPRQQRLMAAMARAGVLDCAGSQYYDWSGFNEPGYIKGRTDTWVSLLGDARKVVVGLSANYNNGPSMDDCVREWSGIKKAYPDIRGMFAWSAQTNLAAGNDWGRRMSSML